MKFKLTIGSVILVVITFAINTAFLQSALTDGYQVSEIKRFLISIESAGNAIEEVLGDNDKRMSVAEMRDILEYQRQAIREHWGSFKNLDLNDKYLQDNELVEMSIVLKSGSKLVTSDIEGVENDIPVELTEQILEISNGSVLTELEFVEDNNNYYVPKLLFDNQGRWIVTLVIQFDKEALRYTVAPKLDVHFIPTFIIGLFSVFNILLLNFKSNPRKALSTKKVFVIDFVSLMLASLLCSLFVNAIIFQRQILEVSTSNARETAAEISSRLNDRLAQRKIGEAYGKQQLGFSDTFFLFDNFEAITIVNSSGKPVYSHRLDRGQRSENESVVENAVIGHLSENQLWVSDKLTDIYKGKGPSGKTLIQISKQDIFVNSVSLLMKGITILFITILVLVEGLLLLLHLLSQKTTTNSDKSRYELGFIRPAMFLFLFAIDLSLSFLPLHMKSFDTDLFGLSRSIVLGLPISSEFLCVGIFILVAGVWMDRRGWHEPFFTGLFVVGIGTLWSWGATDALQFILSRALVGVGYGLALMSAQGMVINFSVTNRRALGFSSLFAGLYSGSICGAATGAILAERFGYGKVFFIGAVVTLFLIAFAWIYMRSAINQPRVSPEPVDKPKQSVKFAPLLKFISNPVFIALSVLSSLPASIAVAGFLHFFTPVYLDQIGARDSTIGQVLILYGICLIYFGPLIGRLIDRAENKKYYMLAGGLLGGLAFVAFDTDFGIASVVVSILLLGLSSSFVLSSQSIIVLELKESRVLGEGTALGIFRSISRIGQVIGPLIFGWVLLSGDLTDVVNYLGYAYIAAMLILAVFVMMPIRNPRYQKPILQE